MKWLCYCTANLLDESIKEKYRQYFINDPLKFMKESIDWNAFSPLLRELYHNETEEGGRPNIPITMMVKVLFLQSIYNLSDEQIEREIHDRISFMNFLDYPDILPDSKTIWFFRERLSKTGERENNMERASETARFKGNKDQKGNPPGRNVHEEEQ